MKRNVQIIAEIDKILIIEVLKTNSRGYNCETFKGMQLPTVTDAGDELEQMFIGSAANS